MEHILYNATNIATFMHLDPKDIVNIEVLSKHKAIVSYRCKVEIKQRNISFPDVLSTVMKNRMKRSRRDPRSGAHDIEITNNYDGTYTAKGQETESTIKPYFNKITCTCSDWSNLAAFDSEQVACEHVYAYLRFIGFNSIYDYILEMKSAKNSQQTSSDSDLQA